MPFDAITSLGMFSSYHIMFQFPEDDLDCSGNDTYSFSVDPRCLSRRELRLFTMCHQNEINAVLIFFVHKSEGGSELKVFTLVFLIVGAKIRLPPP